MSDNLSPEEIKVVFTKEHEEYNKKFTTACERGNLQLIRDLLFRSPLKESPLIQKDWGFALACHNNQLPVVKYLLTSSYLKKNGGVTDINGNNSMGLIWACEDGHLQIVKYLISSPHLIKNGVGFANIHAQGDEGFILACEKGHEELVDYLIFDYGITLTSEIASFLNNPQLPNKLVHEPILKLFQTRDNYNNLQENLKIKPNQKIFKI